MNNIYLEDIKAQKLGGSPLVIETDVLYQWRELVPTYEKRLTQIEHIHLNRIRAEQGQHLCRIEGQKEMPVKQVSLNNIEVNLITGVYIQNEHVVGFELGEEGSDE